MENVVIMDMYELVFGLIMVFNLLVVKDIIIGV